MPTLVVSELAIRELVRETLDGGAEARSTLDMAEAELQADDDPVKVNPNVDPQEAETDPGNPNYTPQSRAEFTVAVRDAVKTVPDTKMAGIFKLFKDAMAEDEVDLRADKEDKVEDNQQKKDKEQEEKKVEEAVRREVRKMLAEITPRFDTSYSGTDYGDSDSDDDDEDGEEKRKFSTMGDVGGATFEEIAKELSFSVAGAKQAVDKALLKAQYVAKEMDQDELEILILTSMNDYIKVLSKTGELSAADVQLMKDHPDIVRELDGFREFLDKQLRRARRKGQKLEDPLGEVDQVTAIESKLRSIDAILREVMSDEDEWDPMAGFSDEERASHEEYEKRGPECPLCGGENTEMNEPMPSMMGHGDDESLHCRDCDRDFAMDPFTGEFGGGKGKHLAREAKGRQTKNASKKLTDKHKKA